jgi:hypothetical protein
VLATYASVLAIGAASWLVGGALLAISGWRRPSYLAPAVGLALLTAICWATVRLPGEGATAAAVTLALALAALAYLWRQGLGWRSAAIGALPVAALALAAASIPFAVEGRFGILGTSFNPDMAQHLLAADHLAAGSEGALAAEGYPLGPHAIVVALHDGLGIGLVQGFSGLTVAVAVLAALAALEMVGDLGPGRRTVGALLVGSPYIVASYLAQGASKETMQALFLLAFAIALSRLARGANGADRPRLLPLAALPPAALAIGSAYAYSFPGLAWLAGTAALWAALELLSRRGGATLAVVRAALPAVTVATLAFAAATAPELGRMIDFGRFETFDPSGPGLGNLFHQISPLEALGIWPSGDFRLDPGDGALPAVAFYAGAALGAVLLAWGLLELLRRGERAVPAALTVAAAAYLVARIGSTPYTTAKAVAMLGAVAMLVIVEPLLRAVPAAPWRVPPRVALRPAFGAAFLAAAAACSVLALANAPVGPTSYSSSLTSLRPVVADGSTLVLASRELLVDEHGAPYISWELRGGRVCVREAPPNRVSGPPPRGVDYVVAESEGPRPPYAHLTLRRRAGPYLLWARRGNAGGPSPCPLVAVRQARQGPA